ncbi:MAG: DUF3467 domain-containing protein, partial [Pirellulaceae bacterium]
MDHPETNSGATTMAPHESAHKSPVSPPGAGVQFEVDDSKTTAGYANCCRLSGTAEELLLDFGFNPYPPGQSTAPIELTQRIVTSWYTAKRLLHALQLSVQRHEAAFGTLETDV